MPGGSEQLCRVRDALDYGPACPQPDAKEPVSEDCLSLNVWTPALRDGGKRPMMVYIHGGEYSSGSGSSPLYDGTRLCLRGDVVVVTVNHRLNAFGHLYLGRLAGADYAASGNAGLLDLVLALSWIRDNAVELGGDPQQVMLFGQSGGAAKIATLLAMPAARGLFQRVATMSGQQITASGPRGATQRAEAYLAALKVDVATALDRFVEYRRMYPQYTPTEIFFAATTAGRSWRGAIIEAELRARQGAPVFAYQLDYRSSLDGGRYGAMHTMDIPPVFDNIAQPGSLTGAHAAVQQVADRMSDAFVAFARGGNPNHDGLPQWRPYDLDTRATMLFDIDCKLIDDPRGGERRLFAQVPYIQRGTY